MMIGKWHFKGQKLHCGVLAPGSFVVQAAAPVSSLPGTGVDPGDKAHGPAETGLKNQRMEG